MYNRHWLTSDWQQRRLSAVRITSSRRRVQRLAVRLIFGAMLMAAVLHLSACHSLPTQPCEPPVLPTMPALTEPLPSVSYSISVGQRIRSWAKELTDTPATSRP